MTDSDNERKTEGECVMFERLSSSVTGTTSACTGFTGCSRPCTGTETYFKLT